MPCPLPIISSPLSSACCTTRSRPEIPAPIPWKLAACANTPRLAPAGPTLAQYFRCWCARCRATHCKGCPRAAAYPAIPDRKAKEADRFRPFRPALRAPAPRRAAAADARRFPRPNRAFPRRTTPAPRQASAPARRIPGHADRDRPPIRSMHIARRKIIQRRLARCRMFPSRPSDDRPENAHRRQKQFSPRGKSWLSCCPYPLPARHPSRPRQWRAEPQSSRQSAAPHRPDPRRAPQPQDRALLLARLHARGPLAKSRGGQILRLKCLGNVCAAPGRTIRRSGRFRGWLRVRRELHESSKARDSLMQITEFRQSARVGTRRAAFARCVTRLHDFHLRDVLELFNLPHQRIFGAIGLHRHLYIEKVPVLGGVRGQVQQVKAAPACDSQDAHQRAFALFHAQLQGEYVHRATSRATSCWCSISVFERPGPTIGQTFAF